MKNDFKWSDMIRNSDGKVSASAIGSLLCLVIGLGLFTAIVIVCLCIKDITRIPLYITLASLSVAIAMSGATVLFGRKVQDAKVSLANITNQLPAGPVTDLLNKVLDPADAIYNNTGSAPISQPGATS